MCCAVVSVARTVRLARCGALSVAVVSYSVNFLGSPARGHHRRPAITAPSSRH